MNKHQLPTQTRAPNYNPNMYRYSRPASPWPRLILIVTVVVAVIVAGTLLFGLPQAAAVAPEGGNVSSLSPITITFNTAMDIASVESRLRIEPSAPGAFNWSGDTMRFTPEGEWPTGVVRVSFEPGAHSQRGLPMLFGANWEFTVGAPGIAYLLTTGDQANIWIMPITGGEPTQITDERFGVDWLAVSPDGTQFVYAARRNDGGADLKRINRDGSGVTGLLDCPSDRCTAPAFSPDGARVAFERYPLSRPDLSTVEVIDLADGHLTFPSGDLTHITRFSSFAPDGRLGYLDVSEQVIAIYDFASGASKSIPNTSGQMGAWSPDGKYIVFPEITSEPPPTPAPGTPAPALQIDTFFSHLRRVTVATDAADNLSGDGAVEDASPVYSPLGDRLAFGRKALEQDKWTPGRQLWVMHADGSDARALTNDPFYNHSAFVWSPDGALIVYVRFDVTDAASTPEIWMMSADGASAQKLVTGGYLPQWLP